MQRLAALNPRTVIRSGIVSLLVVLLVPACGDTPALVGPGSGPGVGEARLRVVHAEPRVGNLNVFVDDTEVLTDLPYLTVSDYLEIESGPHHVAFVVAMGTMDDFHLDFAEGADYTMLPCCSLFPGGTLLTDDNSEPAAGNARIRVVDFATASASVDIYVTAPGADLAAETPTATINILDATDYIEVPAGDYQVRITPWDSETVVIDSGTLTLGAGQVRTAIAVDAAAGGEPFGLLVLEDLN